MKIELLLIDFLNRFFPRCITSKMKIKKCKSAGVEIGKGTVFFDAGSTIVDVSRPALLTIGDYCKITGNCTILTHDYSRSVLRRVYGGIVGEARKTVIGNNVFLGIGSIVLMGTEIGDNCIVGAGSVLHGKYPGNSVIAGNPARVIMKLDEYLKRREERSILEAKDYVRVFYRKYNRYPSIHEMGAFFPIYLKRDRIEIKKNNLKINLSGDEEEEIWEAFKQTKPIYESFEEFLKDCEVQ